MLDYYFQPMLDPTLTTSSLTISFYLTISSTWASLFLSPHYLLAHYLLVTIFSSLTISLSSLIISPPASLSPYQASLSPVNLIIGIPQR